MNNMATVFLQAIGLFLMIASYAILLHAIISWLPISQEHVLVRLLKAFIEPLLKPSRYLIERSILKEAQSQMDFSPFIGYLILNALHNNIMLIIK